MKLRLLALTLSALAAGLTFAPAHAAKTETYYMYVMNEPAPGREDEYNDWYDHRHAPDVVSIPGFVSAQRYIESEHQLRANVHTPAKYVIEFKIVTDDLAAVFAEVNRRIREHVTVMGSAMSSDRSRSGGHTYRAITEPVRGKGGDVPNAGKGPRTHYIQMVFGNATPGKEAQFNDWYNKVHGPSVASTPGFQQWQRFEVSPVQLFGTAEGADRYMIKFDIETTDIEAVFAQFMKDMQSSHLPERGDAGKIGAGYTWKAIGPLLLGDEVRKEREKKGCKIVMPTAACP